MSSTTQANVGPADSYQLDSDEYDSEAGHSDMDEKEYDKIVEEGACSSQTGLAPAR